MRIKVRRTTGESGAIARWKATLMLRTRRTLDFHSLDKQEIEDDVYNTCFICNIDREDFESMNISFEDHIRHDHNLWKYLWFNIYLFEKDTTSTKKKENKVCHSLLIRNWRSFISLPALVPRVCASKNKNKNQRKQFLPRQSCHFIIYKVCNHCC
jgi:hypothetical protein